MGIYQRHHRPPRYVAVWVLAIAFVLGVAGALGTVRALPADATPPKHVKVTICHNGHPITVADDGYWGGHIHHPGDTLGACPTQPTEEPTWTPTPEPSSTASIEPTPVPEPSVSVSATPTPSASPEPTQPQASPTAPEPSPSTSIPSASSPTTSPQPTGTSAPSSSSPVPSVMSTLLPLPVLPESGASSVPYTAPAELAATGMSDAGRAALGVAASLLIIGTVLVLARRKENRS